MAKILEEEREKRILGILSYKNTMSQRMVSLEVREKFWAGDRPHVGEMQTYLARRGHTHITNPTFGFTTY